MRIKWGKLLVCSFISLGTFMVFVCIFLTLQLELNSISRLEVQTLQNNEASYRLVQRKDVVAEPISSRLHHTTAVPRASALMGKIVPGYQGIPDGNVLRLKCNTCSLVSSSGHLYHSRAGAKIDAASCVIRMNSAPTNGYERDVGRRTDVRVIGYTNIIRQKALNIKESYQRWMFGNQNSSTNYVVVHWGHSSYANINKTHEYKVLYIFSQFYKNVKFYMLTSDKTHASVQKVKASTKSKSSFSRFKPSTGWFAMLFALDVCDSVVVYGMAPESFCSTHNNSGNFIRYHYYGGNRGGRNEECKYIEERESARRVTHRMQTEKRIFYNWAKESGGMLSFRYPSWEISNQNSTESSSSSNSTYLQKPDLKKSKKVKRRRIKIVKRRKKRPKKIVSANDSLILKDANR